MVGAAYVDEFSRRPWPGLLLLCSAGVTCLALIDRHHQSFALAWALMLLAMMPVLLAQPATHILRSTRPQRRIRTLAAFGVGYTFVWIVVGPCLLALSLSFGIAAGGGRAALLGVTLLALAWSATPWHQIALNRGHRVKNLAVFGWRADMDAFTYGLIHGVWCVASCWAWMLVALAGRDHHVTVMIIVTLVMLIERLAAPERPKWRLPLSLRLVDRFAHV